MSFFVANLSTPNFQTKVLFGESRQTTNPALKQSRGSFPDQNFISIHPNSMFQKSTICNYRLLCDDYDDAATTTTGAITTTAATTATVATATTTATATSSYDYSLQYHQYFYHRLSDLTSRLTFAHPTPFCEARTLTWQLVPVGSLNLLLFDG